MKRFIFSVIAFSCALFMSMAGTADASKRTALVIGNSDYKTAPLRNPVNDANDIASALKELDFYVIKKTFTAFCLMSLQLQTSDHSVTTKMNFVA